MAIFDHKPVVTKFDFISANNDPAIVDAHSACGSRIGPRKTECSEFSVVAQKGCGEPQICVVHKNTHHVAKIIDALNHGIRLTRDINRLKTAGMHHEAMQVAGPVCILANNLCVIVDVMSGGQ